MAKKGYFRKKKKVPQTMKMPKKPLILTGMVNGKEIIRIEIFPSQKDELGSLPPIITADRF